VINEESNPLPKPTKEIKDKLRIEAPIIELKREPNLTIYPG